MYEWKYNWKIRKFCTSNYVTCVYFRYYEHKNKKHLIQDCNAYIISWPTTILEFIYLLNKHYWVFIVFEALETEI